MGESRNIGKKWENRNIGNNGKWEGNRQKGKSRKIQGKKENTEKNWKIGRNVKI